MSRDSPQAEENSIDYKLLKLFPVNLEQSLFFNIKESQQQAERRKTPVFT